MDRNKFYKINPDDKIWWIANADEVDGEFLFSFDKETIFNLFQDYPDKLTTKQKQLFDKENPFWARYFSPIQ